jgi:hypothetical protein
MNTKLRSNYTLPLSEAIFENKIDILDRLLREEPNNTVHKTTWSAPPTWTVDRLFSILTGGLPSFSLIDQITGSSRFDNWLRHLNKDQAYFFLDVVWKSIFAKETYISIDPKRFKYYNFFTLSNSLNDRILFQDVFEVSFLLNKLLDSRKPFEFIMMHAAEFDHHVHTTSLSNRDTEKILREDEELFSTLIEKMDDETTLIMTADHGLIERGHGGAEIEERKTFLFAHNKKGLLKGNPMFQKHFPENIARKEEDQLALTPTLSLLLNMNPPLNCLDTILPELLPNMNFSTESELISYLLSVYAIVIEQKLKLVSLSSVLKAFRSDLVGNWTKVAAKCSQLRGGAVGGEEFISEAKGLIKEVEELAVWLKEQHAKLSNYSGDRGYMPAMASAVIVAMLAFVFSTCTEFYGLKLVTIRAWHLLAGLLASALLHLVHPDLPFKFAVLLVFAGLLLIYELITIALHPSAFHSHYMTGFFYGHSLAGIAITSRITESVNTMQDKMPFQSLALLYLAVQYPFAALQRLLLGLLQRSPLLPPLLARLRLLLLELPLLVLLSMGDEYFISNFEHGFLIGPYAFLARNRFLTGTLLPGLLTLLGLAYSTLYDLKLPGWLASLHLCNYVFGCLTLYYSERSFFWGRAVAPNLLLLTSLAAGYLSLQHLRTIKKAQARYTMTMLACLILFLLPLFVLIGGHFSAYNILFTVLLILLRYSTDEGKGVVLPAFLVILTRLSFVASGKRKLQQALPLQAGTLFYNDFHSLSWIPVLISTIYPLAVSPLFLFYFQHRTIAKSEEARPTDLKGNTKAVRTADHAKLKELFTASTAILLSETMVLAEILGCTLVFASDAKYVLTDVTNLLLYILIGFVASLGVKAFYFLNIFK